MYNIRHGDKEFLLPICHLSRPCLWQDYTCTFTSRWINWQTTHHSVKHKSRVWQCYSALVTYCVSECHLLYLWKILASHCLSSYNIMCDRNMYVIITLVLLMTIITAYYYIHKLVNSLRLTSSAAFSLINPVSSLWVEQLSKITAQH